MLLLLPLLICGPGSQPKAWCRSSVLSSTVKIGSQVVLQACLLCFSSLSSTVNPAWTMLIVGPSGVIELYTYTKFSKFNSQGPLSVSSTPSVAPSLW